MAEAVAARVVDAAFVVASGHGQAVASMTQLVDVLVAVEVVLVAVVAASRSEAVAAASEP